MILINVGFYFENCSAHILPRASLIQPQFDFGSDLYDVRVLLVDFTTTNLLLYEYYVHSNSRPMIVTV